MEERKVISLLAPGVDEEEMAKKADLVDGKVPASQLPSYVDDVVEYENVEAFPEAGEQGKIYVALDSGFTYRWSGSEYIQIGGQDLSDYYTKGEADQLLDTKQPVGDYATNSALEEGLATKQPVGDYATNTELAEGLATKQPVGDYATNTALTEGLATKQDTISDLSEIRDGAAKGDTALQPSDIVVATDADIELAWHTLVEKGEIISFDAFGDGNLKQFKVIKTEGSITTLLSIDYDVTSKYNDAISKVVFEDNKEYMNYTNSTLDTAIETTYYNRLSEQVKNAIVISNRVQSCYRIDTTTEASSEVDFNINRLNTTKNSYQLYTRVTQHEIGDRHCFALDIDDIKEYFNPAVGEVIPGKDIRNLLFSSSDGSMISYYLATAATTNTKVARCDRYAATIFETIFSDYSSVYIRPAFRIDLSKIQFTRE